MRSVLTTRSGLGAVLALCLAARTTGGAASDVGWPWQQAAGRFAVRSQVELPQTVTADLQALEADVSRTLGLSAGAGRVAVSVFRTRREMSRHLAARVPAAAGRTACFVQGPDAGRVYVHRHGDWQRDLRHESTHALLHSALPYVPLWLDEGLAQYFEAPRAAREDREPYGRAVAWRVRFGWRPGVADLEENREMDDMSPTEYRAAWAWVHFLLHESPETRGLLQEYLREIAAGSAPEPLSERLRRRLPDAEARWAAYFSR